MRMMIDLGSQRGGPLHMNIMDTAMSTSVDCGREVRFRRSFRSFVECMVPACCGGFGFQPSSDSDTTLSGSTSTDTESCSTSTNTITGTFFGYRKGRVSFCLQDDTRCSPLLLLEFAVPTAYLAKEMQHGLLRIALECDKHKHNNYKEYSSSRSSSNTSPAALFNVPVWSMYCNGRKVGYAIRRQYLTKSDAAVLKLMQSVSVGAGVLPSPHPNKSEHLADLMYLRARFQRVIGSIDSESFHIINPLGSTGQELSIFLLRS